VAGKTVSTRLNNEILTKLDAEAARTGSTRAGVIREYLEFCVEPRGWFVAHNLLPVRKKVEESGKTLGDHL